MATDIAGLFGLTPEGLAQQRYQQDLKQGYELAQLSRGDAARATLQSGVGQLGRGIAGLMGVEDPQMQLISARQQIMNQTDQSNPQSLASAAKQLNALGDTQGAIALMDYARKAESDLALSQERQATAAKTRFGIEQEKQLRDELSKLPPDATSDQILAVVTKYGSADKVLASLQGSADKALANQARIDAAKVAAEARIDAAREAGANRMQIAQMQAQSRQELAQLTASLKGPKVLAPGLQKEEDKELELVDSLTARTQALQPALQALTPDPKTKKVPLELGPLNNLRYQAQNAAGNSTPESQKFAELERAVQSATNLKTDAAKGVQTDKDVLRFANELIAAYGKYDTTVTRQALQDFVKATDKARENAQKRIDSRRRSQGIEPYYGNTSGTPSNPIKLD
jgi:hypothetical protein